MRRTNRSLPDPLPLKLPPSWHVRYATPQLSEDSILTCLYSIGDNNSYLRFNRDPIDRVIWYLEHWFGPGAPAEPSFSLAISVGTEGARLSHNHDRQYAYCLQSLTLWREIANDMFKLWYLAEDDLLREHNTYRLCDTGQGLNRVQQARWLSAAAPSYADGCNDC